MMKSKIVCFLCVMVFSLAGNKVWAKNTVVVLETNMGNIEIEFFDKEAPLGTANFLNYVDSGFYNGAIFHRVIPGFMLQGGGFDKNMNKKQTKPPVKNEANNGKKNLRGTLSYARTQNIHSATSQFFINLVDNAFLDYKNARQYGYAVFGKVIKGMNVIDAIGKVKTGRVNMYEDVPKKPVIIIKASRK
ncbi:MAG: peptidyl-prolyl cis-trans isomerase [Deltaproteobacteria bacterium]|nr:peptidyl-prolyl cis-trans isomerase [Deltaproteobacteria bacterium]